MSDFVKDSNPAMVERGTGFLDLPYELRLQIYRLSLPTGMVFNLADRPTFLGLPTIGHGIASTKHEHYLLPGKIEDDDGDYEHLRGDEANALSDENSGEDSTEASDDDSEDDNPEEDDLDYEDDDSEGDDSEDDDSEDDDSEDDDSEDRDSVAGMWYFLDEHKYRPVSPHDKWPNAAPLRGRRVKHIQAYLLVSRQVREEVLDILYGENLFYVCPTTHEHQLSRLTEAKRRRIRHVMLVLRASSFIVKGVQLDVNFKLNKAVWDDILSHVKTLHVVAQQPIRATGRHDWNCVENIKNQLSQWIYVLARILMYLRRKLPTSVGVLVDFNGWKTSLRVFERMLLVPQGFQHVQTKMGDNLFSRHADDYTGHYGPFMGGCDWCETYMIDEDYYSLPTNHWWRLKE